MSQGSFLVEFPKRCGNSPQSGTNTVARIPLRKMIRALKCGPIRMKGANHSVRIRRDLQPAALSASTKSSRVTAVKGEASFLRLHEWMYACVFLSFFTVAKNTKIIFPAVDKELQPNSVAFQQRVISEKVFSFGVKKIFCVETERKKVCKAE